MIPGLPAHSILIFVRILCPSFCAMPATLPFSETTKLT
jgi:hypothetical protein